MAEPQQQSFQRQVAYKVRISDILNAGLSREGGMSVAINGHSVSRVNIISALVHKAEESGYANAMIDDGTGRIFLRNFEKKDIFSKIEIGDAVLVIGKVREFNDERYIVPEIVKIITNQDWVRVRMEEVKGNMPSLETEGKVSGEKISISDDVFPLIRRLDSGDGVLIDDIVKEYKNDNIEEILSSMLKNGDVFEIKPGKIKILE